MEILKELLDMDNIEKMKGCISKWYILYQITEDYDLSLAYLKLDKNSEYTYVADITRDVYVEFRSTFIMRNLCPFILEENPNINDMKLKIKLYIKKKEIDTQHKKKSIDEIISYIKQKAAYEKEIV